MAGAFGYSHLTGEYAGGQAEYVRVPYADIGPIVIPDGIEYDRVLFLSDILPTGWIAAENCAVESGDTIASAGAGRSAFHNSECVPARRGASLQSITIRTRTVSSWRRRSSK
jgi:hypothetical protein